MRNPNKSRAYIKYFIADFHYQHHINSAYNSMNMKVITLVCVCVCGGGGGGGGERAFY